MANDNQELGTYIQHRNHRVAAQQIDAAMRRIGGQLLDNQTITLLIAASQSVATLIVDASVDDSAADGVLEFFCIAVREHAMAAKAIRRLTMQQAKPEGEA